MSILSPLSSPPFTQERLAELLQSPVVADPYPHILRWLIWFPLLSVEEVTRLEQSRITKQEQSRSQSRVAAQLQELEHFQLLAHLVINEPGGPPHQHRYFVTDAGLYLFAAQSNPSLSVPRLAQAYAVERADLIARLARIDIHLVLTDLATRLVSEGSTLGYPLVSYQQPWIQTDTIFGHRQTLRWDAAFLLASPQETEHAFYVHVDTNERHPFNAKRERIPLVRLLHLRHALSLQRETMPHLLIITQASRVADWARLLEKISRQEGTALLEGAITTLEHLQHSGAHGSIWWPFSECIQAMNSGHQQALCNLLGRPVSPTLAERFSQRRSFTHLLTERKSGPVRKTSRPLPSYVGKPFAQEITMLRGPSLADALRGTKREQQEAVALLNLALSAMQKEVVFWLTHHQLLTVHHLATLHHPGGFDIRGAQRQMAGLSSLNLLIPFLWHGTRPWHERERYVLAESALRYSALREGRQGTYYLLPEEYKKPGGVLALSIQSGTSGLFAQMKHTHGLYESMSDLIAEAHREKVRIITWKSAREAIATYNDPYTDVPMQIRPDAELVYQIEGKGVQSILVEYDRATTSRREYNAKYQAYADYQLHTGRVLPPILVVTQDDRSAALIRACVDAMTQESATLLSVIIILQEQLHRPGLLAMLTLLNCPP